MASTFVRPGDADLAAMSRRLNSYLSPEGADAWYRNDVAWLLQEVAILRADLANARQWFYETSNGEGPGPEAPLQDVAYWWQQNATGIWEKAQFKKLKDATAIAKLEAVQAQANVERIEKDRDSIKGMWVEAEEHAKTVQQEYDEFKASMVKDMGAVLERLANMDDVVAQLRRELVEERSAGERNTNMVNEMVGERFGQVRELLEQAIKLL